MTEKFLGYLHGHSEQEERRLRAQALFLEEAVFKNIELSGTSHLLEVGCGVGAQTEILLKRFPHLKITGIDQSPLQVERAQKYFSGLNKAQNLHFLRASADSVPFSDKYFDGAFVCWLLEHLPDPLKALREVHRVLSPGSVLYCTEVMNHSLFLWPESSATQKYWTAYNRYQVSIGGDPEVGAKLGHLLSQSGFKNISIRPLFFLLDQRNGPHKKAMMNYWTELMLSASSDLVKENFVLQSDVEKMQNEMESLKALSQSIFSYTSLQASGQA